jgi:DNA-binding transcriptional MerR regulator
MATEDDNWDDLKKWFTISEVSEMLNIPSTVIRYWETEFPELKPRKNRHGKRMYNHEDIEFLKKLHYLLRVKKYTIKGAKEALKNQKNEIEFQMKARELLLKFKEFLLALKNQ